MKRSVFFSLFLYACIAIYAVDLAGFDYTIDTLESFSAGPGSTYFSLRMSRGGDNLTRMDVYLLRVDTKNPYVSVEEVLGGGKIVGTERPSTMATRMTTERKIYFAGTNGDFFVTQGDVGLPTGMTIVNSEFAYTPTSSSRRLGAVDADGLGRVAQNFNLSAELVLSDERLKINHFNYNRQENELVLYNQHNGQSTGTNDYGTEVLIELVDGQQWTTNGSLSAKVLDKAVNAGDMSIPVGKAVLSAHGTMQPYLDGLQPGELMELNINLQLDGVDANIAQCIGGDNYALIVDDGEVVESNFWDENHPRTAFGQNESGDTLLFCVVDGRGKSVGCNTRLLGAIMKHYGCYKAVNWDGGGSSSLYIRQFGNQMNTGSDGAERAVGNAMFVVANLPETDNSLARIDAYLPVVNLPHYGVFQPQFLGYNKYGVLIDTDVENVQLDCEKETGEIIDGQFVCYGNGKLHYSLGDIEGEIDVRLTENVELNLRLNQVVVSDDSDYNIEVQAVVGKNSITLLPAALDWTVEDETIAVVSEAGVLNGLKNGITKVFARLGDYRDTLQVIVEIPETKPLLWDNMIGFDNRMEMYESGNWKTAFGITNEELAELVIDYQSAGRQPTIEFEGEHKMYSTPKKLELRYRASTFPIENITFAFRAANSLQETAIDPIVVERGTDQSIMIDIDSVMGVHNDMAIYPLYLTYMAFALDQTAPKAEYRLTFDGLYLHYGKEDDEILGVEIVNETENKCYATKMIEAGQIMILLGDERYTITGQKIK